MNYQRKLSSANDNKSAKRESFYLKETTTIFWRSSKGGRLGKFDDLFGFFIKEVAFADVEGKLDYFAWFMEIFASTFEMNSVEPVFCKASFQHQVIRKRQLLI